MNPGRCDRTKQNGWLEATIPLLSIEIQKLGRHRRHHPEESKQAVIEACYEPGAWAAGFAMATVGAPTIPLAACWALQLIIVTPVGCFSIQAKPQGLQASLCIGAPSQPLCRFLTKFPDQSNLFVMT